MSLNSWIGRVLHQMKQTWNNLGVELLLEYRGKVSGHLTDGIAACEPDPGVWIIDVVHDALHHLVQEWLHLLVASLTTG